MDGGHQHDDHGNDGHDSRADAEHVLRRGGAGEEREGTSDWSNPGIGSTNAPGANNPPVFTEGASATRSVSASAPAGTNIGAPVTATDADSGDTLTYSLEGNGTRPRSTSTINGPASHEGRHHADRRRDVHGDGRGRRRDATGPRFRLRLTLRLRRQTTRPCLRRAPAPRGP